MENIRKRLESYINDIGTNVNVKRFILFVNLNKKLY